MFLTLNVLIIFACFHSQVAKAKPTGCEPCFCNSTSNTMECFDLPYITRPNFGIQRVVIHNADFDYFDRSKLINLTGVRVTDLTFSNCNLSFVYPRTLFTRIRSLQVLRLNRTMINVGALRLALYSLRLTDIREVYLDDLDPAPLPLQALGGLGSSRVSVVSLRRNSIGELWFPDGSHVFRGVPNLKTLVLSENQITVVKNNSFPGFKVLLHLYLDRNKLKKLEAFAFQIPSLVTLSLAQNNFDFSTLTEPLSLFSQLKKLKVLNISRNDLKSLNRKSLSLLFRNLTELAVLKLGYTGLKFLPDDVFDGLNSLKELYLEGNQLKSWEPEMFQRMDKLEAAFINKNKIQTVTMQQIYSLTNKSHPVQINLADNPFLCTCTLLDFLQWLRQVKLKPVGYPDLYTCMSPFELYQIPLSDVGKNETGCYKKGSGNIDALKDPCYPCHCNESRAEMVCKGPQLEYIPHLPFHVTRVSVYGVKLATLGQQAFRNLSGEIIKELGVRNSIVTSKELSSFPKLTALETLDFSGTTLSATALREALCSLRSTNLQNLFLDNIGLTKFPNDLLVGANKCKLTTLSMAKNSLVSLPSDGGVFDGFHMMKSLNLSNNQIKHIGNTSFTVLVSLQKLDISYNYIETIGMLTFNLPNLTHLWFHNNDYTFLSHAARHIFRHLNRLKLLDLSRNNLSGLDTCSLYKLFNELRELETLNLASTEITVLPNQVLKGFSNLRVLNLANNRIIWIDPKLELDFGHLTFLSLEGNQIETFDKELIDKFSLGNKLTLNLARNPLKCSCASKEFYEWIQATHVTLVDYPEKYICATPSGESGKLISTYKPPISCTKHPRIIGPAVIGGVVCSILMLLLSIAAILYYRRKDIWLSTIRWKARLRSHRVERLIDDHQ